MKLFLSVILVATLSMSIIMAIKELSEMILEADTVLSKAWAFLVTAGIVGFWAYAVVWTVDFLMSGII